MSSSFSRSFSPSQNVIPTLITLVNLQGYCDSYVKRERLTPNERILIQYLEQYLNGNAYYESLVWDLIVLLDLDLSGNNSANDFFNLQYKYIEIDSRFTSAFFQNIQSGANQWEQYKGESFALKPCNSYLMIVEG